jgi:phosphoglycolate phosphatase
VPEKNKIRLIVYTPLEETFAHPLGDAVVFTGSGDPWVGGEASPIPQICAERDIPCFVIKNANHSLETHDPLLDIRNLQEIMERTTSFIRKEQLCRIASG